MNDAVIVICVSLETGTKVRALSTNRPLNGLGWGLKAFRGWKKENLKPSVNKLDGRWLRCPAQGVKKTHVDCCSGEGRKREDTGKQPGRPFHEKQRGVN